MGGVSARPVVKLADLRAHFASGAELVPRTPPGLFHASNYRIVLSLRDEKGDLRTQKDIARDMLFVMTTQQQLGWPLNTTVSFDSDKEVWRAMVSAKYHELGKWHSVEQDMAYIDVWPWSERGNR
jgi:hypothetical protein